MASYISITITKGVHVYQVISLDFEWIHWSNELHPHFVIVNVHKKSKRNFKKDGNNYRSPWQEEWNYLLVLILCKIMFCLERQLLLHVLSLLKHVMPNLDESDCQWQILPKVQKLSLVMIISIHLCVWWGKRWETSFCTWALLSNAIATKIFQSISWVIVCSFSHMQHNKWIPKLLMVWSHWHCKTCIIIGCGITIINWPKYNHSICDYMRLFLVLVILATTLQLVCDYFNVHLYMWTTFNLVFIQEKQFMSH
jgi:hypothetical protein